MRLISDTELNRTRRIVIAKLRAETKLWVHVFCDRHDYEGWLTSATYEGITLALDSEDKFDPTRSDFVHWAYLKTRKAAWRDIRREQRHGELIELLEREPVTTSDDDPFGQNLLAGSMLDGLRLELTNDQMKALALIYVIGFSHQEVAVELRRDRHAIDALVHRAKAKARLVYKRNLDDAESSVIGAKAKEKRPKNRPGPQHRARGALSEEHQDVFPGEESRRQRAQGD